jgi:hypothetical protein
MSTRIYDPETFEDIVGEDDDNEFDEEQPTGNDDGKWNM